MTPPPFHESEDAPWASAVKPLTLPSLGIQVNLKISNDLLLLPNMTFIGLYI